MHDAKKKKIELKKEVDKSTIRVRALKCAHSFDVSRNSVEI